MGNRIPVVALFGSNGNLGSRVLNASLSENYILVPVKRNNANESEFYLNPSNELSHKEGIIPDLIVNLANFYSPVENTQNTQEMQQAILGLTSTIMKHVQKHGTRVISASTYFQYAPVNMRPWSKYAEFKHRAQQEMVDCCTKKQTHFTDFVLFDNYGGRLRGKFIDRIIECLISGESIEATQGNQLINLTHIDDIARAFIEEMNRILCTEKPEQSIYSVKSDYTRTLREVVADMQETTARRIDVSWGSIPYREKEVFHNWEIDLENPPKWRPTINFTNWVRDMPYGKLG